MTAEKLLEAASRHGAIVTYGDGRFPSVCAEAPRGKCWADELHELVQEADTIAAARKELAQRMNELGVHDCETPECEWCSGE